MADTQFGILVNLNDNENGATQEKDIDEIENTRMVADPESNDCIMNSPTIPHHSAGSDDLITNEEFNFDVPLSPSTNIVNSTFIKEAPEVCEDDGEGEDEEDEVFFGPIGFTELVVKKAAEEQEAETKMWSALTDAEMKEVMSEANRMAELIQEASETSSNQKNVIQQDSAATPSLQSKPPSISLSKILDSAKKLTPATSEAAICSLTVVKSPATVSVCKESLKQVKTKLFSPSASTSQTAKENDSPKTRSKATPNSSGQLQKKPSSAPSARPVRRTESLSRRSGSWLKPPTSHKSQLQEPNLAGTKRKKLDMNQSAEELQTSMNSSNCSEATSETSVLSLANSRLRAPSLTSIGSGLKRPYIKSSLQAPKAGLPKRSKMDGNQSSDELHTSLNSSTSSDISYDIAALQPSTQTKRSLLVPSKLRKLPSVLPKPGGGAPSGMTQPSRVPGTATSANASKPAIKSTLTKLDKLKSSLGVGASRITGGSSRLVKPGTTSMLARPSGPLKALKPASVLGQQSGPLAKKTAPNKFIGTSQNTTPPRSGKLTEDRRKSVGSPSGHMTPKRTGVNRSQSFSGQRTQKISSGSTPGSGQRRSLLPTVNKRERTFSSSSSVPSYGSSVGETPRTLADIQNIADASPTCFKKRLSGTPKAARMLHTPLTKESTAKSKVSRWSPVPRRKPMSGEEYFVCTKRYGAQN